MDAMGVAAVIERFASLFEGNKERYGRDNGGSIPSPNAWRTVAEAHLFGDIEPIGVYPIDPTTGLCRWGCIDFDEGERDSLIHAINVTRTLQCLGIKGWIERSRSKGYHVWVFCTDWIPPLYMRQALLYVCLIVEAPSKEVNPKQIELKPGQIGNYVRLPYPAVLTPDQRGAERGRRVVVNPDSGFDMRFEEFVKGAFKHRALPADIASVATKSHFPLRPAGASLSAPRPQRHVEADNELIGRLSRRARRMYEYDGPPLRDRSAALVRFAHLVASDHTHADPAEFRAIVVAADSKWGKYSTRHDADARIDDIMSGVYNRIDSPY